MLKENYMTQSSPQGYLSLPPSKTGPGILVFHAWWGLNGTIKTFCRRLADSGFVAFAPDLYHGKVAETIVNAQTLADTLFEHHIQTKAEISAAARFLCDHPMVVGKGITVIGFSLGAFYSLDIAASEPEHVHAVVIFYGTADLDHSTSNATYLGHFAEDDPYEPQTNVNSLEDDLTRAGRPVTFFHYPGTGHWFFEPDRKEAYNQAAADLAWDRTLSFLRRTNHAKNEPR